MKNFLHSADYILWIAIIGLQWTVLIAAIRRGIKKRMPAYIAFISFLSIQSPALFLISRTFSYNAYVWSFYLGMCGETALLVYVLHDVFKAGFSPLESLPPNTLPRLACISTIVLAGIIAVSIRLPASGEPKLFAFCRTYHRAAEVIICICLWAVVLYARHLGISWQTRVVGIAGGFLFYLTIQAVTISLIAMNPGAQAATWLSRVGIVAYLATLGTWIRAIVCKEVIASLPTPAVLLKARTIMAQLQMDSGKLTIERKTGLIEE